MTSIIKNHQNKNHSYSFHLLKIMNNVHQYMLIGKKSTKIEILADSNF